MEQDDVQIGKSIADWNGMTVRGSGLRFDRVVVRLLRDIRRSVEPEICEGITVVMTITAPLKHPAKTVIAMTAMIKDLVDAGKFDKGKKKTVFENEVHLMLVHSDSRNIKYVGLVHNPQVKANGLLDLAVQWLRKE